MNPGLALLTDLYQLTMAYGYWKTGKDKCDATFHLFFRKNPFGGEYAVACGLGTVLEFLKDFRFHESDLEFLDGLNGNNGEALFDPAFIDYLRTMSLDGVRVDAVPEGTVVFPHEPILRVQGPIIQCQLLETALLNIINFQTLIATKASRVCYAAGGNPVLEFGLRRAQGIDGGLSASRAAYIGGCFATSNVLAGKMYGIPVRGTHAHSWVESFDSERESFSAYARVMPNNCTFLVDTYDTIEGVKNAIEVAKLMREQGHGMGGIRLDSGDLVELSKTARKMLDEAGFADARIVASNDLDEYEIERLVEEGARIDIWGVGTRLVTGGDQPALGGVYKLAALEEPGKPWRDCIKLSDDDAKTSIPGVLQVRRFYDAKGYASEDVIYDENAPGNLQDCGQDLLVSVFGLKTRPQPSSLDGIRARVFGDLPRFGPYRGLVGVKARMKKSHLTPEWYSHCHKSYPVSLEPSLKARREKIIKEHRERRKSMVQPGV